MEENLRSKLPHTETSIFSVMTQMANQYGAINLSQGFPNFEGDPKLIEWVTEGMRNGFNQYAPLAGLPILREGISRLVQYFYGVDVDPNKEITVTSGATEALMSSLQAFIHPGDEVIMLDPSYDSYQPAVELAGGKAIRIPLLPPEYEIDWELIEKRMTPKTRALLLNSPHNPVGRIFHDDDINALKNLVNHYQLILISDEVYEHMVYDGHQHQSLIKVPELRERSVVISSFGKTLHQTGWKIGYAIAPPALTQEIQKVHQFVTFSSGTPFQYGIGKYLHHSLEVIGEISSFYQAKRDLFLELMQNTPFRPLACEGTYFQLMDYSAISKSPDTIFAENLTKEHGVASIPISVFYEGGIDQHIVRFCFAKDDQTLIDAAKRLQKAFG